MIRLRQTEASLVRPLSYHCPDYRAAITVLRPSNVDCIITQPPTMTPACTTPPPIPPKPIGPIRSRLGPPPQIVVNKDCHTFSLFSLKCLRYSLLVFLHGLFLFLKQLSERQYFPDLNSKSLTSLIKSFATA